MMATDISTALDILRSRLGAERVQTDAEACRRTAGSWSPLAAKTRQSRDTPHFAAVTAPADAEGVAATVAWARETGTRLVPVGGGSNTVGSTTPDEGNIPFVAVDLSALKDIDWSEESLTVTVGAGWTVGELERTLNAHDYTMGQYPQSFDLLTIGGAISTDAIGALAGKYGRFSDITVGVSAVLPTGAIITSQASPLASAGFGLWQLFPGTEGRFGIVTGATLRMRPAPEARAWAAFTFTGFAEGIDALRLTHRTDARPSGVRLLDRAAAGPLADAVNLPPRGALLLLAFEGDEIVQTGHFQMAYAICQQAGGTPATAPDLGERWFADWRAVPGAAYAANGRVGGLADVFRLSAPYPALKAVRADVQAALTPFVTAQSAQTGWADSVGASLEIAWEAQATTDTAAVPLYRRILDAGLDACLAAGGAVAFAGGIGQTRRAHVARERGTACETAMEAFWAALEQ